MKSNYVHTKRRYMNYNSMNIKINHLQHIGIPVTNLQQSELFYERLGFKNVMAEDFDHPGGSGKVAMMKQGEMIVELYQMPPAAQEEVRSRKNGHIDHIAFDVDDIDATYQTIKNMGLQIIEPQPVYLSFWKKGCKYFNITGPDGERLEFNQIL